MPTGTLAVQIFWSLFLSQQQMTGECFTCRPVLLPYCNWIGYILRRNCLLLKVIEGRIQGEIEVTGIRGGRRRKLLDDLKERRGYSNLKGEALDRCVWRARFGRGFGPVVRQTAK
jgi:hypothetical protein